MRRESHGANTTPDSLTHWRSNVARRICIPIRRWAFDVQRSTSISNNQLVFTPYRAHNPAPNRSEDGFQVSAFWIEERDKEQDKEQDKELCI